jgi:hypothetical protein
MAVRARDLRRNVRELGFEKGVTATLELALEELSELRQHVTECVGLTGRCIDQVDQMIKVGDGMHQRLDAMTRVMNQGSDDDGSSTKQ